MADVNGSGSGDSGSNRMRRRGSGSDSGDVDSDGEEREVDVDEVIEVDFDFCDPSEDDWHLVKRALMTFLGKTEYHVGGLAAHITEQCGVGTVVKVEENLIGFISVLNLSGGHPGDFVGQITAYMSAIAARGDSADPDGKLRLNAEALAGYWSDQESPLGLIINWRVANAPQDLAFHLHNALFNEILDVAPTEPEFAFSHYVIITSCYTEKDGGNQEEPGTQRRKRMRKDTSTLHYFRAEDGVYHQNAVCAFTFDVDEDMKEKLTFDEAVEVHGLAMVVPADGIQERVVAGMMALMSGED